MISMILFAGISSCTRIEPGYTGFKYSYGGSNKGLPETTDVLGWVTYTPGFTRVVQFPISMQHYILTANSGEGDVKNEEISIPLKGGSSFLCDVGINYTVIPAKASYIFFTYKTDDLETITRTYLRTTVRNCMANVSSTITMDDM